MGEEAAAKTPEPESEPERPKILLVFRYRYLNHKGVVYNDFVRITEAQFKKGKLPAKIGDLSRTYKRTSKATRGSALASANSGAVYRVEHTPDNEGTIYPNSATFEGRWPDDEDCMTWGIQDRAARDVIESKKGEKLLQKHDYLDEALEPIKRVYARLRGPQRAQLIAAVVKRITRT